MTYGTYPEIKTVHNWFRHFKDSGYKEIDNLEEAQEFIRMNRNWQIYTEIEGETGTLYYDRGFHICNRTGYYIVVNDPRYKVMQYTGLC